MPNPPHDTNRLRTLLTACLVLLLVASGTVVVMGFSSGALTEIYSFDYDQEPDGLTQVSGSEIEHNLDQTPPQDKDWRIGFNHSFDLDSAGFSSTRIYLLDSSGQNGVGLILRVEAPGATAADEDRIDLMNISSGTAVRVDRLAVSPGTFDSGANFSLDYNSANDSWRGIETDRGVSTSWVEFPSDRSPGNLDVVEHGGGSDPIGLSTTYDPENGRIHHGFTSGGCGANCTQTSIWDYTTYEGDPQAFVLDVVGYMRPNTTQPYTVTYTNGTGEHDVTDATNTTVTSSNSTIVSVDEGNNELVGPSDENISGEVTITAQYNFTDEFGELQEFEDTQNVTVAQSTMKNFDILPSAWRINALFAWDMGTGDQASDTLPLIILISIFAGGITARVVSSFAGIGAMLLVIIVGWFGGWVGEGVVLSALFVGLFIGFNLAANIDYAVRR